MAFTGNLKPDGTKELECEFQAWFAANRRCLRQNVFFFVVNLVFAAIFWSSGVWLSGLPSLIVSFFFLFSIIKIKCERKARIKSGVPV